MDILLGNTKRSVIGSCFSIPHLYISLPLLVTLGALI